MRKRIVSTWEREREIEREMIISSSAATSTWDKRLFSTMKERWIASSSYLSLLATWWDIGFFSQMREKHGLLPCEWEERWSIIAFFWFHHERERDGLLLLLLPHEEEDCSFFMKEMIASFAFTWDQGFVSHASAACKSHPFMWARE
jgi:hypothetical protein